jgi:hypothetical protein
MVGIVCSFVCSKTCKAGCGWSLRPVCAGWSASRSLTHRQNAAEPPGCPQNLPESFSARMRAAHALKVKPDDFSGVLAVRRGKKEPTLVMSQ